MPIPRLNAEGLLPEGIHDCSLAEIRDAFGMFQESDRRTKLFERLEDLVTEARKSALFEMIIVDGSFVTDRPSPNDVDLIAVLRPGHDFERDLPVSEYALLSRTLLRRRFGFDVLVAEAGSRLHDTYVDFFGRVRENPALRKGLLRVRL